ncbi:MAG: nucleotidyltransferase family protein [Bacteroidales bacterium]|nr:nucleotidyltransferase family protein [Bacteroidales bacterium]
MKSLEEIKLSICNEKQHLFAKYPIKSLAIFGSYARKEQNDQSDVDILVEFDDNIGIRFIDLADEIESITGIKTDLVSRNGIKDRYFNVIKPDLIYV